MLKSKFSLLLLGAIFIALAIFSIPSSSPAEARGLLAEPVVEIEEDYPLEYVACEPLVVLGPQLVASEIYAGLSMSDHFDHTRAAEWSRYLTQVAIGETGHSLSLGTGANNNVFGLKYERGIADFGAKKDKSGNCSFENVSDCLNFVIVRITHLYPPNENESPREYLERTGWNPNPGYFDFIDSVKVPFVCPDKPFTWKIPKQDGKTVSYDPQRTNATRGEPNSQL